MFTRVEIEYSNPIDLDDSYHVTFKLKEHAVAKKWATMVDIANRKYEIDDPGRFYGFYGREELIARALGKINRTIDVINEFEKIIDRRLEDIFDQDTLNYLHHVFEVHHGLLDSQTSDFWNKAPDSIRKALADLNIQVHECESVGRSKDPRPANAVTWYKMPKVTKLQDEDYKLFEMGKRAGIIYLLYVEIGKTLEALSIDNDRYISDTAFKPFRNISADFIITFYDDDPTQVETKYHNMKLFYHKHEKFFTDQGLSWGHPYLFPGSIPVAEIENMSADLIDKIKTRQWVKSITLY
jgi:hypothetical protein